MDKDHLETGDVNGESRDAGEHELAEVLHRGEEGGLQGLDYHFPHYLYHSYHLGTEQ